MVTKVPVPVSGGLILSYRCTAACRHCMYACSPKWEPDWIPQKDLERVLEQLARTIGPGPYGPGSLGLNHGLHFTGGEPFLNLELLCTAVEIAESLGIPSTFVETNSAWCVDDRTTRDTLRLLESKGLKGIMVSVNPFFLEYVPFERTERAVRRGFEIFGDNLIVYQVDYYRRFKARGIRSRVELGDYLRLEGNEDLFKSVELFLMGRAPYALAKLLDKHIRRQPARHFLQEPCVPPIVRSWHNHFDNYGNYVPGYCGGLSYGDCRDLRGLLRDGVSVEERPILGFLMADDMRGLLEFARDLGYRDADGGYFSKCHLCVDLRRHLVRTGDFKELAPRQFYEQLQPGEAGSD